LFGHLTGFAGLIHDLIVEHREVQSQTESDWVGGLQVFVGRFSGGIIGFEGILRDLLHLVTFGVLTDVPEVVTLHLEEEDFALSGLGLWNQVIIDEAKDVIAELIELLFDFGLVVSNELSLVGISSSLLDAAKSSPSRSS